MRLQYDFGNGPQGISPCVERSLTASDVAHKAVVSEFENKRAYVPIA